MFANVFMASANTIKDATIEFSLDDFNLTMIDDTTVSINSDKYIMSYDEKNGAPALPYVVVDVEIPIETSFVKESHTIKRLMLKSGVSLSKIQYFNTEENGVLTPLNSIQNIGVDRKDIRFSRIFKLNGKSYVQFIVSPFSWNPIEKSLIFNQSFSLSILLGKESCVPNYVARNHLYGVSAIKQLIPSYPIDGVDYVIFTNNSLFPAFKRLADWKNSKGVNTVVLPIGILPQWDDSYDDMLNIKYTIYALANDFGCKYVLLGGDEKVIPVAGCYGQVSDSDANLESRSNIPTDLFYACPEGSFDWDANNNGIKGELDDNVDLTQWVAISRASLSNLDDANAFVSKIIDYESHPDTNWSQEMLRVGQVFSDEKALSGKEFDFRNESRNIAKSKILPYWNGNISELYSFQENTNVANSELTKKNLDWQFRKGYGFVDFNGGNGANSFWYTKTGDFYFMTDALKQTRFDGRNNTIITSSGHQNNFVMNALSLSEGFLGGANNGVVAFLGSGFVPSVKMMFGKERKSSHLGTYIGTFYKKLFEPQRDVMRIGDVVRAMKDEFSSYIYDGLYRWFQFSVNLLGDPEMPIYIAKPKHITDITIDYTGNVISVNTGDMNCDITIAHTYKSNDMRNGSLAIFYKESDVKNATFSDVTESGVLSISKEGYVPFVIPFDSGRLYIQSETISGNHTYSADVVYIGNGVTSSKPTGDVVFEDGRILVVANEVNVQPGTEIELGTEVEFKQK